MKTSCFRLIALIFFILLSTAACQAEATPDPGLPAAPVTMENVCEHDGQVVEVEGELILPQSVSCSREDPYFCQLDLYDPFREIAVIVEMPAYTGDESLPVNYMANLPDSFETQDFYIHTANDTLAGDGSLVSIRGEVNTDYSGLSCSLTNVESITKLDYLAYVGVDLTRVTLQEALTDGLVVASITGDGLSQIDLSLKPNVELNLEVEIEAGTLFLSGTDGVQNMVLRQDEYVYLKPNVEVSVELEVSCANMELKQPGGSDAFTVSSDPPIEDLVRLFALDEFPFNDLEFQQVAVWTITDNPGFGAYVGIESDGTTYLPWEDDIARLKNVFEDAGIDTTQYRVFDY